MTERYYKREYEHEYYISIVSNNFSSNPDSVITSESNEMEEPVK